MSDAPVTPEVVDAASTDVEKSEPAAVEPILHRIETPFEAKWRHIATVAKTVASTEFVPRAYRDRPAAVMACLAYGSELGLGEMQSLQSINVIDGKPTLAPEAMRSLVRRAGHKIETVAYQDDVVTLQGTRDDGSAEVVSFTMDDARRAGLVRDKSAWTKYPRAMLSARATSELCRLLFSDVIMGASYTPEEMGGENQREEWTEEPEGPIPMDEPRQPAVRIVTNNPARAGHAVRAEVAAAPPAPSEWGWHSVIDDGVTVAICNRCTHPVLSHSTVRRGCFHCACNYALDADSGTMKTVGAANPTPSVGEREPAGQPVNDRPESVEGSLPSPTPATVTPPTSDGGLVPGQTDVQPAGSTSHPPAGPTADLAPPPAPPSVFRGVHAALRDVGVDDDGRHAIVAFVTGHRTESSKDLTSDEAGVVLSLLGQLRVRRVAIDRQFGVVALDPKGQEFLDAINPRNAEPLFVDTADVGTIGD